MKYEILQTTRFKKRLKKMLKRRKDRTKTSTGVAMLARGETLPMEVHSGANQLSLKKIAPL